MLKNFERLSVGLPVGPLLAALERQPHLWGEITERQKFERSPHKDTEAIFLRWNADLSVVAAFTEIDCKDYPAFHQLPEARDLVQTLTYMVGASQVGRVIITKLKPFGFITPHIDEGASADYYDRFHVILSSNEQSRFCVEEERGCGEFVTMRPGEAWWFNHKKTHYVYNDGAEPRLHLIIDAVSPEYRSRRELST